MKNLSSLLYRLISGEWLIFYCCDDPPPAPDFSAEAAESKRLAKLAESITTDIRNFANTAVVGSEELVKQVLSVQIPIMQQTFQAYQEGRARYEDVFVPLEDSLVQEAMSFTSPERLELEAGRAGATAKRAAEAERLNIERRLQGFGVDPSQLRARSLDTQYALGTAATVAAEENKARLQAENVGRALRSEAINLGTQRVADTRADAVLSANVGSNTTNIRNAATGTNINALAAPLAGTATAGNLVGQAVNIKNAQYQNQLSEFESDGGFGDILGTVAGIGTAYFTGGASLAAGTAASKAAGAAEGGAVDAPGGPTTDSGAIRISDDEFVIPADVVRRKGTEFFDKLITKTKEDMAQNSRRVQAVPAAAPIAGVGGY